jgi:hypothetical protein
MLYGLVKMLAVPAPALLVVLGIGIIATIIVYAVEAYEQSIVQCLLAVLLPCYVLYFGFVRSRRSPQLIVGFVLMIAAFLVLSGVRSYMRMVG